MKIKSQVANYLLALNPRCPAGMLRRCQTAAFQLLGIEMHDCFILIRAFLRVALSVTKQIQPTLEKVIRLLFLIMLTKVELKCSPFSKNQQTD